MKEDPSLPSSQPAITFFRTSQQGEPEYLQVTFRSMAALKHLICEELPALPANQRSDDPLNTLLAADECRAIEGVRRFKSLEDLFKGRATPPSVPPPPSEDPSVAEGTKTRRPSPRKNPGRAAPRQTPLRPFRRPTLTGKSCV